MKTISKPQISKIHVLLTQTGLIEDKKKIIIHFSNGRTDHVSNLYSQEAKSLISQLSEHSPQERLKSLIFSLAYQAGIIYGSSADDKKINAAKLNLFLRQRGTVKKDLNDLTYPELVKVHRQFEAIVKSTAKSAANKEANRIVHNLLEELNIKTQ